MSKLADTGRPLAARILTAVMLLAFFSMRPAPADVIVPRVPGDAIIHMPPTGLMVYATGGADVDATCKKPNYFDKQREESATAETVLTTSWSDSCADRGAESAGELHGIAGYAQLTALATGSYTTNKDRGAFNNASVMVMFSDQLSFELIGGASNPPAKSSCGISVGAQPLDWVCVNVRLTTVATFVPASYDSAGGTFSSVYFSLGDPGLFGTAQPATLWTCNGFDSCRGGQYSDYKTVTVIVGKWPSGNLAGQPIAFPLTARAQGTVVVGAVARPVSNDFAAGVSNVKLCVDPVAGSPAIRVISKSGTDYSNAANHCY
jgi:hypothetical protein